MGRQIAIGNVYVPQFRPGAGLGVKYCVGHFLAKRLVYFTRFVENLAESLKNEFFYEIRDMIAGLQSREAYPCETPHSDSAGGKNQLYGLLLAGGKSSRMGFDKASMIMCADGVTQARRSALLLGQCCGRVCISLREGQAAPDGVPDITVLRDTSEDMGPLAGILAAFRKEPDAAWLVLACDLPFITLEVLTRLVARHRENPDAPFTACARASDGRPEPLCAIYAPSALAILQAYAGRGKFSPRDIMLREGAQLVVLPEHDALALENINTLDDLCSATRMASTL